MVEPDKKEEITAEIIQSRHSRSFRNDFRKGKDFMQENVEFLTNKKKQVKVNGMTFTMDIIKQNLVNYYKWILPISLLFSIALSMVPLIIIKV